MTGWVNFLCDLPDDGGVTIERILASMPLGSAFLLTHHPVCYRLRLSSSGAVLALSLVVPGLIQIEGITADSEVLVPDAARAACDHWLDQLCSESRLWAQLQHVEAREDAWALFVERWGLQASVGRAA